MGILAENRRARFDYMVIDTLQAGIVLNGQETKSVFAGRANIGAAFVTVHNPSTGSGQAELWLTNAAIPPWQVKNASTEYEETRSRKLLCHKKEIASLIGKIKAEGLTVVPLRLYTQGRRIKVELGIVRSRKKADKRELLKKREAERDVRRALKR